MARLLLFLLGTFASLYAGQAPAVADKPKDEKCSVEGRVVNSVTGEAVKRVALTLTSSDIFARSNTYAIESGEDGGFAFYDLQPGRYTLAAQRSRFTNKRTPLVLSAGQQIKDLLFKLRPGAIISGRVLDGEGEPMESVRVLALRSSYQRGERQWSAQTTATTNDLGEFRMASLEAGSYIVAASRDGVENLPGDSGKAAGDKPEMFYALTYYPNASDFSGAAPVRVELGADIRLGDIQMLKLPGVRVSGKLVGNVEGSSSVRLVPKGGGPLASRAGKSVSLRTGVTFTFKGVARGSYTLIGSSGGVSLPSSPVPRTPVLGSQTIEVGGQNIEGILLQLAPGSDLPGVVTVEGKGKVSTAKVIVRLNSSAGLAGVGGSGEDGKFTLRNVLADRYQIQLSNEPEGSYVKSIRLGGQEVTEGDLDLAGGVSGPLQITLSSEGAQVDGVVQDSDNGPVVGATVVLVPDSRRYSLYKEEQTDQNGKFSLKGVTPGGYKLLAWEDIETGAYQDPEFLKKYESKAESLSLKEGDRRTVQVKVIPFEKLP